MPGPNVILDKGYQATGAIRQFRVVVQAAANESCTEAAALGARPLGVCQEECSAADGTLGRVVNIRKMGNSRCIAGAVLAGGTPVRADAQGRIVALAAATANQLQLGVTTSSSTAIGDHIDVDLTPGASVST